jgi:hypothetical protein
MKTTKNVSNGKTSINGVKSTAMGRRIRFSRRHLHHRRHPFCPTH